MKALYNFGIFIYKTLVTVVSVKNKKARKLCAGHKRIFSYLEANAVPEGGYIWIHASSLGEFEQGRPIIEALKNNFPERKILVTFFSPSGYEVRKDYAEADLICYLPFDLPGNVRRFLDIVKPSQAIFIKYEFWANYLNELKKREIPTYIVSAIFRPSQIFFRPYGGYFRKVLRNFTRLYVQDEPSRELLSQIGVDRVTVVGDTRFDRVADIRSRSKSLPLVEMFSEGKTTLIAGSSWPKDEDIFIPYLNAHSELKLVIAPHEIHPGHLDYIKEKLKRRYVLYSEADENSVREADCLIIDCFGLLSSIYKYGDVAYVGGGFGAGIHNVPEAAVYGIPVIFGPNYKKFKEAKELLACGGSFTIKSNEEFDCIMDRFLTDTSVMSKAGEIAGSYIYGNIGASARIIKDLYGIDMKNGEDR
ncbi:3-deoxy-D-manno-octulosonic acid transferase [Coprobacter tertius]|uniref:3-deoxy-D-manno-octulosonic acid transferase n=1 Tax=Coprobacter tertius TaxID=2944915 RepID=A0ABT1MDR4_9BACT|nr:glycosyltransferase N-terminal domain-containing protein [Coprobacter tertius]MCP9610768.1 3-deoxy-D-manno-octulosonic acid transferase [Coprobacter tertius]